MILIHAHLTSVQSPSPDLAPHQQMGVLTIQEKKFLLAVERGDVASTRR